MGKRGELWFAFQIILFGLILIAPTVSSFPFPLWLRGLGLLILLMGGLIGTLGLVRLGRNLSPFPKPIDGGQLVQTGIYGWVRHPIYSGLIFSAFGWSLLTNTLLGLALVVVLFIFFDLKSRREERWLAETYPDYTEYKQHVKKLIPGVY
ncbi:MAG: isoprenylcysteine carboxylmethyltransferase family protein [Anaerolineae bacterium]